MKRRELKTLWSSNANWSYSGYGVEMGFILPRLVKDGWPVAQSAFYGLEGNPIMHEGVKVYPKMADPFGGDAMVEHTRDYGANVTFTMQDLPTLNPQFLASVPNKCFIPWVPIDHDPVPQIVLNQLRYAYKIITMSRFGQKELEKAGFVSTLILEGTDVNIFKPLDKAECRKQLDLPQDVFIWGMIGANKENPPRKSFQEAMEAFKLFHDKHPEAAMFFHTQQTAPNGFPVMEYAKFLGIADKIFFLNQYKATFSAGPELVAQEINACDAILHPSQTEGFGLVIIEAQACGKPIIVSNCTSMPELVVEGKTGELAEIASKRFTNQGSFVFVPDPDSIYAKMETIYANLKKDPKFYDIATRKNIVDNYNIDTLVKEKWIPLYEELQDEILTKPENPATINPAT